MAVGFRRQRQNHLGRVDRAFNLRPPLTDAFIGVAVIQLTEEFDLLLGVPVDALAAVAEFFQQWPQRGELLVDGRVVTFDHLQVRGVLARLWGHAGGFPVGTAKGLGQFADAVVQ
ncbi:hypothetical protein D3C81_975940 [compost metagenome]